jgi:hypothetical protein
LNSYFLSHEAGGVLSQDGKGSTNSSGGKGKCKFFFSAAGCKNASCEYTHDDSKQKGEEGIGSSSPIVKPPVVAQSTWEVETDKDVWTPFGPKEVQLFETALKQGRTSAKFIIGEWTYLADFSTNIQTNTGTGTKRKIRRKSPVANGSAAVANGSAAAVAPPTEVEGPVYFYLPSVESRPLPFTAPRIKFALSTKALMFVAPVMPQTGVCPWVFGPRPWSNGASSVRSGAVTRRAWMKSSNSKDLKK